MKSILFALLLALHYTCIAQDASELYAETNIANLNLNTQNSWSIINNPAGVSKIEKINIGLFFKNHFLLDDFSTQLITAAFPLKKSLCLGAYLFRFGNNYFSKNEISSALSLPINEKIALGAQIHCQFIYQSDLENRYNAMPSIGLTYLLNNNFQISSSFKNFFKKNSNNEKQFFRIGCSYLFDKKVKCHFQSIFSNRKYPIIGLAIDYKLQEKISFKFNISNNDQPFHFGISYLIKSIFISIDLGYHQQLGFSPSCSISL